MTQKKNKTQNNSIQPQPQNNYQLTVKQVSEVMPPHLQRSISQDLVDQLNNLAYDPIVADAIRDNFLSYTKVLQEGRFKTEDYLNAVKFVSFKLMGHSNQEAYYKTFPQRHANLLARNATKQEISAYVSMYAKGKLVNLILEQSLVPSWVLNQDIYQKAINVQAEIMTDDSASFMARTTAANSLLNHLSKPEMKGPVINLDMRETSGIAELKESFRNLAQQQKALIESGATAKQIAAQKIIEVDPAGE